MTCNPVIVVGRQISVSDGAGDTLQRQFSDGCSKSGWRSDEQDSTRNTEEVWEADGCSCSDAG